MTGAAGAIAAVAVMMLSVGANAQAPAGQPSRNESFVPRHEATEVMAACLLKRDHGAAKAFVLSDMAAGKEVSPELKKVRDGVIDAMTNCGRAEFRSVTMAGVELRGILAEALLKEGGGAALARVKTLPAEPPQRVPYGVATNATLATFDCAVRAKPTEAWSLITADRASIAESSAFDAFGPALQACVPLQVAMNIKPGMVRSWVALSLYRRAVAPAQG